MAFVDTVEVSLPYHEDLPLEVINELVRDAGFKAYPQRAKGRGAGQSSSGLRSIAIRSSHIGGSRM